MKIKSSTQWLFSGCDQLKTGTHFGHKSIRLSKTLFWHPLMSYYILGIRNGVSILNTQQTRKCLLKAFYVIALLLKKGGHILIINTNPDFFQLNTNISHFSPIDEFVTNQRFVDNSSMGGLLNSPNVSFCFYKWVGGTLTNWKQISQSVLTFAKFSERCEPFLLKNNMEFPRYKKIKKCFQGLLTKRNGKIFLAFSEKPDLIFLMNPNENRNIISEANILQIPVIALVESNTNLTGITYPIPTNNYSIHFLYFCMKKIVKLVSQMDHLSH